MARAFRNVVCALATWLVIACGGGPTCHGPSRAVTPPREVRAPELTLAGMRLDMTATEARQACLKMDGLFREPAFCRPSSAQPSLISRDASLLYAVDLGFDQFGHAKQIKAVYGGDSALLAEQLKSTVEQISATLGDPRSGELAWCARAGNCSGTSYTEWAFEGGAVRLAAEVSETSLELELTHAHDDMSEHVIYGLPVCG